MGRVVGTSRIAVVARRSVERVAVNGSLRRGGARRPPTTLIACALGITASLMVAAVAVQVADALQSPRFVGFPPIP
jgi:hypothetical protein